MPPNFNEAETRAKLIDPAIHQRGWTEDLIKREENAGGLYKVRGRWRRDVKHADYLLRIPVRGGSEPIAVAVLEAKKNTLPPHHGLEQAKLYASADRLNVPFVLCSNGYRFIEFDKSTGVVSQPQSLVQFPSPTNLRQRYETYKGIDLEAEAANPLTIPYTGGDAVRRYYQDAAIRAALEKIAAGENHVLLSLATGAGKTRIAVHLLKKIADAGQLHRVLFVCDRTELRDQALGAFQNVFGNDAQPVSSKNARKNARILIATYQTLDVDTDESDANFFIQNYPENYFSHIVIDEAHRSAWGKWSIVLTQNSDAVQIGLTATPRQLTPTVDTPETKSDLQITADNLAYFDEPVYEYTLTQGIADGYLAACEVQKGRVNIDDTGITREQILELNPIDAITGQPVTAEEIYELYEKTSYEDRILLPDRVLAMTQDLFNYLIESGGPEQKTIIFCQKDSHADRVAAAMQNLYANWCKQNNQSQCDNYAFKCTAASSGNDMLPDLRGSSTSYFIATTVELITTGVDIPRIQNIVFYRYLKSPISFYQMIGRGMRLFPENNKIAFTVYDYTGATELFGEDFISKPPRTISDGSDVGLPGTDGYDDETVKSIEVEGFDVFITDAGRYIVVDREGKSVPITIEEYKQEVAELLVEQAPTLNSFRTIWIDPEARHDLMVSLPHDGQSVLLIRDMDNMQYYDLYDVLADIGYGMSPRTFDERADAFSYKHDAWLKTLPSDVSNVIQAIAAQFKNGGTNELESQYIWHVPAVRQAGGLRSLKTIGDPNQLLKDTKTRIFAV